MKSLSCVQLFAIPWTVVYGASLSMGFSRQEYWSELPFPSPRDLPDPGIQPRSPALQADALPSEPPGKPLYITGPKQLIMICFGVIFYMFCALEFIHLLCGFIVFIKFQNFSLIISSGVFLSTHHPLGIPISPLLSYLKLSHRLLMLCSLFLFRFLSVFHFG